MTLLRTLIAAAALASAQPPPPGIIDHFKYGSIGAEERTGVPYWIWLVLPEVFPDLLPQKPGDGYRKFGFLYESGQSRPIGTTRTDRRVPLLGLNCAACHTGLLLDAPSAEPNILLGMPAHQLDLQAYQRFLFACFRDPRFTYKTLWPAMRARNPKLNWFDGILYRLFVFPRTRRISARLEAEAAWTASRPPPGPGRVDTFNPYKVFFNLNIASDSTVGSADLPPLFNQSVREGMWLHWDGNNDRVKERNYSAAIGAGCSESSLKVAAIDRVADWIWTLPPPAFPAEKVRRDRAAAGEAVYKRECAACHDPGGARTGFTIRAAEVGTDPERLLSFTFELAVKMNTLGQGRPWKFTRFRKTDGYAAMPLDGVWLRAPYLHNGSVPSLRLLLEPPDKRPAVFWRGYSVYDYTNLGFVWSGPEAEAAGFRYDTAQKGNSRAGHLYGTALPPGEKDDLIEYLKTR